MSKPFLLLYYLFICFFNLFQSLNQQEILNALKKRLEQTAVPEFPRHRLRMLSRLGEGAFGTVIMNVLLYYKARMYT